MKLNTNSNVYTLVYASVLVIFAAFLLAFVASALKSKQDENVANDKRGQILAALNIRNTPDVVAAYQKNIVGAPVLNVKGEVVDTAGGFDVDSKDITAKEDAKKRLPLYVAKVNNDTIYVVPLFGRGLWGGISGYLALKKDFNTVYGAYFTHESETAGLGARIVEEDFQRKFIGKKVFTDDSFNKVALALSKKIEDPEHQVDAMTARYVEVFKGANALRFGAGTLGGALNFVSRTAQTDSTTSVKLEGGSYGTIGLTFTTGKRMGAWDMFVASTYNTQKGYRIYNENNRLTASFNVGWKNQKHTIVGILIVYRC